MSNYDNEREMWDAAAPRPASTTPVLKAMWQRVIRNRYAKPCEGCGVTVAPDQGYSAVGVANDWHTYCAPCAEAPTFTAFIGRMYTEAGATIRAMDPQPASVAAALESVRPTLQALVAAPSDFTTFLQSYGAMLGVLGSIAEARLVEVREGLCDDPLYQGLTLALTYCQGRFREAAESMLRQWEAKGALSGKQVSYAQAIAADANKRAEAAAPLPDVPPALYIDNEGTVRRIYRIGSSRLGARKFNGTVFQAEGANGLRAVADGLAAGTTHQLTGDEATAFGRQHGRCFNCLSIGRPGVLSDDRSLAMGYGPDCADHHGWFYPTAQQAAEILRPTA